MEDNNKDKEKKSSGNQINELKKETDELKPNKNIKPPRFYSLSEGVDPKKFGDSVVKEKEEKKYNDGQ